MSVQFSVLASGSSGNASLLEVDGFGVLIDAGLGPRLLAARLAAVGASWQRIHAVLLTHTHTDHWKDRTLAHLRRLRIPLYCHAQHRADLLANSFAFAPLRMANLVRHYSHETEFVLQLRDSRDAGKLETCPTDGQGAWPRVRCRPLLLRHDGVLTSGFRLQVSDRAGQEHALAYAADLGSWPDELAGQLANVDVLALEFNHDVAMEYASGRSAQLIARVLGDDGHLSNEQAASLLREIIRLSAPGRLQHLVQLHLSRECNRPGLAVHAAREALAACRADARIHTAHQFRPGPILRLGAAARLPQRTHAQLVAVRQGAHVQPWLPGWDD